MAKSKKEKKQARKERHEQLRAAAESVQERLLASAHDTGREEVTYVLADPPEDSVVAATAPRAADGHNLAMDEAGADAASMASDEEEDRVRLPAAPSATPAAAAAAAVARRRAALKASGVEVTSRKHRRMSWQALKLAVTDRYGAAAAELVSEHDGNAEDPLFTVLMKMEPHTVPVPRHWDRLRSFMSLQTDREGAVGIVPAEIQALGVDKLRASKDKRGGADQRAFMTCFMTGTPLQRKTFHVSLSRFGDVFHESKWLPKAHYEPGQLSQRLRQALGMGGSAPPPWLYSMQRMRRLPPAYPGLRVPGLNAPIPPGAQWGRGQGQWGDPPRGENNNFLFPGVMDEAAAAASSALRLWGVVPPLATAAAEGEGRGVAGGEGRSAAPPPPPVVAAAAPASEPTITINPTPFRPQAYQPSPAVVARPVSTTPQEYVRVQDSAGGATVAVGHRMVLKSAVAAADVPQGVVGGFHGPAPGPSKAPAPGQPSAKQPPVNPRSNRGTKF